MSDLKETKEDFTHLDTVVATIQKVESVEVGTLKITSGDNNGLFCPVEIYFDGVQQKNVRSLKLEGGVGSAWVLTMEQFIVKGKEGTP